MLRLRLTALSLAPLFFVAATTSLHAQRPDPYYQLQCSLSGAYCDRVYDYHPPPRESFDALLERKARERAQAEQAHQDALARTRAQKEQRDLAARQAVVEQQARDRAARIAAQEARARQEAEWIANAPAWVLVFRTAWPAPQWLIGLGLTAFAVVATIGHRQFSSAPPGVIPLAHLIVALFCLSYTYGASASATAGVMLILALSPGIAFLVFNFPDFLRGWHYLFVRHTAKPYIEPALSTGTGFDRRAADTMEMPSAWATNPPPSYKSHHEANEADILKQNVHHDTSTWHQWTAALKRRVQKNRELAQAMAERARARAEYERWKKRVDAMEKDKGKGKET